VVATGGSGADGFSPGQYGGGGGGGGVYGGGGGASGSEGAGGGGGGGSSGFGTGTTSTSVHADSAGAPVITLTYTMTETTTTTVSASHTHSKISAKGKVKPAAPGVKMHVTLARKSGKHYKSVATRRPILSTGGKYATSFARPKPGKCEITAAFPGYKNFKKSSITKKFGC
jgi:hypothetical protein